MNPPDFAPDETWLRSRFAGSRRVEPVTAGDGHLWRSDREIRPAAVLVPVVKRDGGLTVLFTRRTAHLHDHAGQISFPGGRAEAEDAGAAETAMREAAEEIGLSAAQVADTIERLEAAIRDTYPDVKQTFIEAVSIAAGARPS